MERCSLEASKLHRAFKSTPPLHNYPLTDMDIRVELLSRAVTLSLVQCCTDSSQLCYWVWRSETIAERGGAHWHRTPLTASCRGSVWCGHPWQMEFAIHQRAYVKPLDVVKIFKKTSAQSRAKYSLLPSTWASSAGGIAKWGPDACERLRAYHTQEVIGLIRRASEPRSERNVRIEWAGMMGVQY